MTVYDNGDWFLSIHDLTRRSTIRAFCALSKYRIFQFTTSQGGRPAPTPF